MYLDPRILPSLEEERQTQTQLNKSEPHTFCSRHHFPDPVTDGLVLLRFYLTRCPRETALVPQPLRRSLLNPDDAITLIANRRCVAAPTSRCLPRLCRAYRGQDHASSEDLTEPVNFCGRLNPTLFRYAPPESDPLIKVLSHSVRLIRRRRPDFHSDF